MTIPVTVPGSIGLQAGPSPTGPWTGLAASDLGSLLRTRRYALAPGQTRTGRYWRVVKVGATDWGSTVLSLGGIAFWQERAFSDPSEVPLVRIMRFAFDDDEQRYTLVHTLGNIEVYWQGQRVASVVSPYDQSLIPYVTQTQALDTLITFNQEAAPRRFMRQGSHAEWDSRDLTFDKLPVYDYDGTGAGGVNEVQEIDFDSYSNGDKFFIELEGQATGAIVYSTSAGTIEANITTALELLDSIGPGNVDVTQISSTRVQVEFIGDLANTDMSQMAAETVLSASGTVSVLTVTQGVPGGEPVISATRGWPACGVFYQQRLYMLGLKSRPEGLIGSGTGVYYNFKFATAEPDGSIDEDMNTDQVTAIVAVFPGQHLQIFTKSAEFFVPTEPLTPPVPVKKASSRGVMVGTPQFELTDEDGGASTVFVGAGGGAVYLFGFDFARENYVAPNIAVDASHIVKGVVDVGFRKHRTTDVDGCDLGLFIRNTGDIAAMVALRDQSITGFFPWTTQGQFLAAGCELNGDMYVVTARTLPGGQVVRLLEKMDQTALLDSSVPIAQGQSVVNLPHLKGATVAVYVDGSDLGDMVVDASSGQIALPYPALRGGEVGLLFQPHGLTMPAILQQDPRSGAELKARIAEAAFQLGPTAGLKIKSGVGSRYYTVPLKTQDPALPDEGAGENAFQGWTHLRGLPGAGQDAQVEFLQDRPGPLKILQMVTKVTT